MKLLAQNTELQDELTAKEAELGDLYEMLPDDLGLGEDQEEPDESSHLPTSPTFDTAHGKSMEEISDRL